MGTSQTVFGGFSLLWGNDRSSSCRWYHAPLRSEHSSLLCVPYAHYLRSGCAALFPPHRWDHCSTGQYPIRRPDDGIRRSGRRGLIAGLIFGGVSCLMFSFFFSNVIDGVLCGWIVGLWFGLFNGGMAWIKHFLLRWLLWRDGSIPWDYSAFLNYAAERMLLRKVGRGYQFFHPLFLNHFVTLDLSVLIHQEAEQEAADALGFS